MSAARLNIRFNRGTTLYRQIVIKGTPAPVGTTFHLHLLADIHDETPLMEFVSVSIESALGTSFSMELSAYATLEGSLPNDTYAYRVEAVLPDTLAVVRILQGDLVILP